LLSDEKIRILFPQVVWKQKYGEVGIEIITLSQHPSGIGRPKLLNWTIFNQVIAGTDLAAEGVVF